MEEQEITEDDLHPDTIAHKKAYAGYLREKQKEAEDNEAGRKKIYDFILDIPNMPGKVVNKIKNKLTPIKKAKGGSVSSASKRADGCAVRGKTRGKIV